MNGKRTAKKRRRELSAREIEVVQQLASGVPRRNIGKKLYIRGTTVRTHIQNVYRKLGLTNQVELAVWAYRNKLVRP